MLCVMVKGWVNLTGLLFSSHRWVAFQMQQYKVLDNLTWDGPAGMWCDRLENHSLLNHFVSSAFFFSNKPEQTVLLAPEKMGTFKVRLFPPIWHPVAH